MKDYAKAFYKSPAWKKCRAAYAKSRGGLCERCLSKGIYKPGVIVHHKVYLTPENIGDPTVTLDWSNLELVCRSCHDAEHELGKQRRLRAAAEKNKKQRNFDELRGYSVAEDGSVTPLRP